MTTTEVGRARLRKEDAHLITGRSKYTDNITLPGMLYLAMVRSPFAHAKITSVDAPPRRPPPASSRCSPEPTWPPSRAACPTPGR